MDTKSLQQSILFDLLQVLGLNIRQLSLSPTLRVHRLSNGIAWSVIFYCKELCHLSIALEHSSQLEATLPTVVALRGSQLEMFELTLPSPDRMLVISIARSCAHLKRLSIRCDRISASLHPIWEGLGSSLRDIDLCSIKPIPVAELRGVGEKCKVIPRLSLSSPLFAAELSDEHLAAIEELCLCYGE